MKSMANGEKNTQNFEYAQASQDFNKARNRAFLSRLQNFMDSKRDDLLSFYDVKDILKPKGQVYIGMQAIPIRLILGSEGRYRDFNKYFLPRSEYLRARWERVDMAQIKDIPLPAIQLYEIGGAYFVRDGNHRVSVARAQGVQEIDAEVISLSSEINITPSMTQDDLLNAVIDYEKKIFYEKTQFEELTKDKNLNFSITGCYDKIYQHILEHKYFRNENSSEEIPFPDALVSWYKEVYGPIIKIIDDEKLCRNFPGQSQSDLYLWIVRHWDFLKKKNGVHYSVSKAAQNFSLRYGSRKTFLHSLGVFLRRFFKTQMVFL
jgi:hypothetical protein